MAQPEKLTTQEYIIERLQDIQQKAEVHNYSDALASIKEVKAADTKNIYLVAIEKQIAKLNDPTLPQENRAEIVKSLPAMINRALNDIQRKAQAPQVQPKQPIVEAESPQKEQKEAALEKLKKQYFQRADEYVEKKEYQHALEEIRRIYIIEPGSVVAKEYEKKIGQLSVLQSKAEAQPASDTETNKNVKVSEGKKESKSAPAFEQPKEKVVLEEEPKKSKLPIIAAAAIVLIAIGAWLFFSKGSSDKPAEEIAAQQASPSQDSIAAAAAATVASTPQPVKGYQQTSGNSKKTNNEIKPAATEKKPATTPVTTPVTPVKTPATQPARTTQQTTQPVTSTTPPVQQPQTTPAESTPAPVPFVAIESQPEIIKREPAVYPEIAIKMGIQGRVTVEVTVDAQGKPVQTKVVKSTSEIFNDAAVQAVMKYSFKPAMMSTGPITAKVYIPIDFRMKR